MEYNKDGRLRGGGLTGHPIQVKIKEAWEGMDKSLKVGDIVDVKHYGTFGCWDENDRWVSFYNSEVLKEYEPRKY